MTAALGVKQHSLAGIGHSIATTDRLVILVTTTLHTAGEKNKHVQVQCKHDSRLRNARAWKDWWHEGMSGDQGCHLASLTLLKGWLPWEEQH